MSALAFYDHHRQSYGHMPIGQGQAVAEFMVSDDTEDGQGGEFAICLYLHGQQFCRPEHLVAQIRAFSDATGSLRAFIESGAWDVIAQASEVNRIGSRDDLTALLVGAGMRDRSDFPVGHCPVCSCCGRPTVEAVT